MFHVRIQLALNSTTEKMPVGVRFAFPGLLQTAVGRFLDCSSDRLIVTQPVVISDLAVLGVVLVCAGCHVKGDERSAVCHLCGNPDLFDAVTSIATLLLPGRETTSGFVDSSAFRRLLRLELGEDYDAVLTGRSTVRDVPERVDNNFWGHPRKGLHNPVSKNFQSLQGVDVRFCYRFRCAVGECQSRTY